MERLQDDLKQKHGARKYKIEAVFRIDSIPPFSDSFSASCIYPVEGDNGLDLVVERKKLDEVKVEDFHYEGQKKLSAQDSISIKRKLLCFLFISPAYIDYHKSFAYDYYPPYPYADNDETMRWFDIKAFKISYGLNSVYRINLLKKTNRGHVLWNTPHNYLFWYHDYTATAYFDYRTLLITQFKGDSKYKQNSTHFQVDYDEEGGTPVIKQIICDYILYNMEIKCTVRRIE